MAQIGTDSLVTPEGANAVFQLRNTADQEADFIAITLDGSASAANGDYTQVLGNFSVPAQTTSSVAVQTGADSTIEGDETFEFVMIGQGGTTLDGGGAAIIATATIQEPGLPGKIVATRYLQGPAPVPHAALPTAHIRDSAMFEGTDGSIFMPFLVSLDRPATADVTFNYSLVKGSASAADVSLNSSGVTIRAGEQSAIILVTVNGDTVKEQTETFDLRLTGASGAVFALGADAVSATGTIFDSRMIGPAHDGGIGDFGFALFGNAANRITGGRAADQIDAGGGNDRVSGGSGNDDIRGGDGQDSIDGASGNDRLIGGTGNDTLTGGAGSDAFAFADASARGGGWGKDVVTDFERGHDKIDFSGARTIHGFSDLTITNSAKGAVISTGHGDTITLAGLKPAQLHASDFLFAHAAFAPDATPPSPEHFAMVHAAPWMSDSILVALV